MTAAALALDKRKKNGHQLRLTMRPGAPSRYVFLIIQCGASSAEATTGDPSAPAKTIQKNPCDYKGHTHTHSKVPTGGRGRERREKEREERKGQEGVPSYDTSIQGHTKRREEKGSQL